MSDEQDEPTQETQPKRGKPSSIPVPTRKDVFRDLERVAKPRKQNGGPSLKR